MKDSRIGESLWLEWSGEDYELFSSSSLVFYTEDHVDLDNDVVRRALASALQRDGVAISLGDGYKLAESATASQGFAGTVDESIELYICDEYGEIRDGDTVDSIEKITWVEIECREA